MLRGWQSGANGVKLLTRRGDFIQTVPAIGATNILEHMIPDVEIVECLIRVLESLASSRRHDDFERHIFNQIMRYTILRSVVSDPVQINYFFDNISKIEYLRGQILFWLQWHMAKVDTKEFVLAENYLEQGYKEAASYEKNNGIKYNRKQLDDRKAKFLMLRAQHVLRRPDELYRDFRESCEIVGRLMRDEAITHHPFDTFQIIVETFGKKAHELTPHLASIISGLVAAGQKHAESRVNKVAEGYQRNNALRALEIVRRAAN
jgi:hypothetical protein